MPTMEIADPFGIVLVRSHFGSGLVLQFGAGLLGYQFFNGFCFVGVPTLIPHFGVYVR